MRAVTLKASAAGLGGLLTYYGGLAEARADRGPVDYYLDPDEPAGRWWGQGRSALGVAGDVEAAELRAVLEGRHPVTGEQLGRSFGDSSARAFDATFSAPKSVSVLWALTPDPWVRAEVLAAHDGAVAAALDWFERHGAVTRRGTDGVHQVDTQGVTAALFRQHTSRTVDPQLHTHAVIAAKVQDPTGRWLSLDARFLKYQQRTIGWIYDAALRSELTGRLGLSWTTAEGGTPELAMVPEAVRREFSRRSAQVAAKRDELIERWSLDHLGTDPDPRTIARLERAAVLASRPAKAHGIDPVGLHRGWADQARAIGLEPYDLAAPGPGSGPSSGPWLGSQPTVFEEEAIATEALRRLVEESSTWLPADVARHVATLLPPNAAPDARGLVELIDRVSDRAVERCLELSPERLGPQRSDGRPVAEHVIDRRLTTADVLNQERSLTTWARGHAYPVGPGTGNRQTDAAEAIAGPAQLVLVVGPAGTGKTRATALAVRDLQARDRPVIGLAPSGKAADVLRAEAACPTDTLAGFLTRHRDRYESPWPIGTTVIVDEAGMAKTQDLAELVGLARRHHWRIVAVGDPAQLPPVGRGGLFAHWCDTVPHHELDHPRRFHEPWEADASLGLRRGDPTAVERYDQHHRLHTTHPALLPRRIADTYLAHVEAGRSVAITTTSSAAAREINQAIQARRPERDGPGVELADGTRALAGDQIATRRNDPMLRTTSGERVRNRQVWTVERVDEHGRLTVGAPDRGTVVLPADYAARHIELGWAVTGYGNQGDTVDIGLAVIEPGTSRNHAYVALTRGREANHAYVPDPIGTLDPAEHLTHVIDRANEREAAIPTLERLHHQAGLEPPEIDLVLGLDRSFGRER
jgi:conjugative relaxase-like TrwC/TraI family protein